MAIRIGLVGHGEIVAGKLLPALQQVPGVVLRSVAGRALERVRAFAEPHGARAFASVTEMLEDPELDAVIVATPDRLHAEHVMLAAAAGKHVLVEKPMATSLAEAEQMVEACRRHGVRLAVGYHHRWHAGHRRLVEAVRSGQLGEVLQFEGVWCYPSAPSDWRNTSQLGRWWSLGAVGTHLVDLAWWMLGEVSQVQIVTSHATTGGPHDESAVVSMAFASGATAAVTVSVVRPARREFQLTGRKVAARAVGTLGGRGAGQIFLGSEVFPFEPGDPYVAELTDFVAAIRERRDPEVDGQVGLANVRLLQGA